MRRVPGICGARENSEHLGEHLKMDQLEAAMYYVMQNYGCHVQTAQQNSHVYTLSILTLLAKHDLNISLCGSCGTERTAMTRS